MFDVFGLDRFFGFDIWIGERKCIWKIVYFFFCLKICRFYIGVGFGYGYINIIRNFFVVNKSDFYWEGFVIDIYCCNFDRFIFCDIDFFIFWIVVGIVCFCYGSMCIECFFN